MIGAYIIYLFITCVCIRGDFATPYCTYINLKREKILYIKGINFKVMHTCGSRFYQWLCPHGNYSSPLLWPLSLANGHIVIITLYVCPFIGHSKSTYWVIKKVTCHACTSCMLLMKSAPLVQLAHAPYMLKLQGKDTILSSIVNTSEGPMQSISWR